MPGLDETIIAFYRGFGKEKKSVKNEETCNRWIKNFEKLKSRIEEEGNANIVRDLDEIEEVGSWLASADEEDIKDALKEIEIQLSDVMMHSGIHPSAPQTSHSETSGITSPVVVNVEQRQDTRQFQYAAQTHVLNIENLIDVVQSLNISQTERNEAIKNIKTLQKEMKKDEPDENKIKEVIDWAVDFGKKHPQILQPIITALQNVWNRLF